MKAPEAKYPLGLLIVLHDRYDQLKRLVREVC